MVSFNEFKKQGLRTAVVKKAEDIPGKDKLYKLIVDLGSEERTIVAGIKQDYSKEELQGKTIIVAANLDAASIAGVESNGMLLAVKGTDGKYKLLVPDGETAAGTDVE